jgi:hypothetical protein
MQMEAWLSRDDQFVPGAEIFRCNRRFSVWAYSVSHSQLLLRARTVVPGGGRQSRIDVLFKPVRVMKTCMDYETLVIRCATDDERELLAGATGPKGTNYHVFVLETPTGLDYVIAGAVGWKEDDEDDYQPSSLAYFPPATNPDRVLPTTSEPT